jgi:hypothetical protein
MTIQEIIAYLEKAEALAEQLARESQILDGINPDDGGYHPTDAYIRGCLEATIKVAASYLKHWTRNPSRL